VRKDNQPIVTCLQLSPSVATHLDCNSLAFLLLADRKKNNDMGGDAGGALDQAIAGTYKGGPKKQGGKPAASVNRQYKDAKFGYGGMKRRAKQNDKASADDMSQFSARANKAPVPVSCLERSCLVVERALAHSFRLCDIRGSKGRLSALSTKSDLANQLGRNDSAAGSSCTCMSARM
jgi:hypothetical protein